MLQHNEAEKYRRSLADDIFECNLFNGMLNIWL